MSPYERMVEQYTLHPQACGFTTYLDWHSKHGFVFITPDFFCMGRHVRRDAPVADICEPTHLFTKEESDCWYVHAASGDMRKMWSILPWELPWIAFERWREGKLELAFFLTELLKRHIPPDLSHETFPHAQYLRADP
jgi:hypothetical protein